MNERILELAKQAEIKFEAHLQHLGIDTAVITPADLEKFAELIVSECLFIIDDEREPEMVNRLELWKQIKQHF